MPQITTTKHTTLRASSALLIAMVAISALMLSAHQAVQAQHPSLPPHPAEEARKKERANRLAEFKAIVEGEDSDRVDALLDMLSEESDPVVLRKMADMCAELKNVEEFEEFENALTRDWAGDDEHYYSALYLMIGIAKAKQTRGDEVLEAVLFDTGKKDTYIKTAAIEAIRIAKRKDLASLIRRTLAPEKGDKIDTKAWNKDETMLPVACFIAAMDLEEKENRIELMKGIVKALEFKLTERSRWYALQACSKITKMPAIDDVDYWRYWVETAGGDEDRKPSAGRTNALPPTFFDLNPVGRRLIYIIDISQSMENPWKAPPELIDPPENEKDPVTGRKPEKKVRKDDQGNEIPKPDYKLIDTKMGLAKAELIYAIRQLDKSYSFNVIIYEKDHRFLFEDDQEFYEATPGTREKFIDAIEELSPTATTNIHGALMRGFRTTADGYIEPAEVGEEEEADQNPGIAKKAVESGADTIFFLTDGWPTWSDESEEYNQASNSGDGMYCFREAILADMWRKNVFRRVVIHTIGIGNHDKTLLKELAEDHHGKYRDMKGDK